MSIARSAKAKLLLLVLLAFPVSVLVLAQEQQAQQTQQPTPAQPAPAQPAPSGQEQGQQEQPQEEVVYTPEEYAAYDKAVKETDLAAREEGIIAYIKTYPKSSLVTYAISSYLELMQQYLNEGNMQKLVAAGEKMLALRPDEMPVVYRTGIGYFQTQQHQKAVGALERAYQKEPDPKIAFMLAVSYSALQNDEKVVQYGELACGSFEPKDCYQILTQLTRIYLEKKQWAKAADYAKKTLSAFEQVAKPPAISQAEWDDYVAREKAIAYSALGRQAFERNNLAATLTNYQSALKTYRKLPGLNAEAYYHIGLAHWKSGDPAKLEPAMKSFARGAVLNGAPHQKACREQLEYLYKSQHNGSLAGIEEFIEEALKGAS